MASTKKAKTNDLDDQKGFRFFGAIGKFSIRYRWLVLIVWIVGSGLIVRNLPSLTSVTQSNNENFLPSNSPTQQALNIESKFEPTNVTTIPVIIVTSGSQLSSNDQTSIDQLSTALSHVTDVEKVIDRGRSPDGQAEILEVQASNQKGTNDPTSFIDNLRSAISSSNLPSDLQAHLTGPLAEEVDNSKGSGKQNSDLQLGTVIFIIVLLLLIFRAPLAPIITLIPPLFVVSTAGPLVAEAAHHGLKVSSLAQLLMTVLILGAGTDYGLFLIFRVREELQNGKSNREAIAHAMSRVGESITFSAATVIVALLSLLFATFQIYSNLGVPLAMGIGLMLLAGLTLLPALLAIFGRAVFWPFKRRDGRKFGLWGRICARVVQHPAPVLIVGVVIFGTLATAVHGYQAGGFGGQSSPPSGSDSAQGDSLLAKHFPQNSSNPTEVLFVLPQTAWQNPEPLVQAESLLKASPAFNNVTGPFNPNGASLSPATFQSLYKQLGSPGSLLPVEPTSDSGIPPALYQIYRASGAYISPDGKTIQYAVGLAAGDPTTTKAMKATPYIRQQVTDIANKIHAKNSAMLGESSAFYDISNISNNDLMRVIPIAIVVIGILLGFLMRSLVAPIYLVISVVLSYLAALGLAVILFIDIGHESGIVFILPFLMFIFLLALGEDYNILVMTRIREEAHAMPLKKAVTQALNTTGTTVTSAGLVLAGTFTVLGVVAGSGAANEQVRDIGFGLAIGILMDTFLVRTLLVPSIVVLLGRWNWWPTKHGSWIDESESK